MCGIIGIFNHEDAINRVIKASLLIKDRGLDGFGIATENGLSHFESIDTYTNVSIEKQSSYAMSHLLHSVVNYVKQPITDEVLEKFIFAINCEIYNWKELDKKHNYHSRNDAEVLLHLIKDKGIDSILEILNELDGVYAFSYYDKKTKKLYLARDILGVKPIWYSHDEKLGFGFASEKKALLEAGYLIADELIPRKVLIYDTVTKKISFLEREFFEIEPEHTTDISEMKTKVYEKILKAIKKRIPDQKFGILFSGGIDSTVIAKVCQNYGTDFICYTAALVEEGLGQSEDLAYAKRIAEEFGFELRIITLTLAEVEGYLQKVVPLIEDNNVVKVGVGLTFYVACEAAKKDNIKVIFSGLGSEEIFGGYQRHRNAQNINKECISGLLKMYERDLYRDDVVSMNNNLELRLPFLDKELASYALKVPEVHKMNDDFGKIILRYVAEDKLKLPKEYSWRKKKAAQYGSKFDKALEKLTHRAGFKLKSQYLERFSTIKNPRLCAMISSGKDGIYAAYTMQNQNYPLVCFLTMVSENPDSYMYHTPNIFLVDLQAEAMEIPLVKQTTEGKKEDELKDLKIGLLKAKELYNIEGVVTGAITSNYQRQRIEAVCDGLGLKIFSPLWHINQIRYMRQLLKDNFEVTLSSIAAYGLTKDWLGKIINENSINKLISIDQKIGLNVAFEGGEAESLVLDCPLFKKKIELENVEIQVETEDCARMNVKKAKLVDKN